MKINKEKTIDSKFVNQRKRERKFFISFGKWWNERKYSCIIFPFLHCPFWILDPEVQCVCEHIIIIIIMVIIIIVVFLFIYIKRACQTQESYGSDPIRSDRPTKRVTDFHSFQSHFLVVQICLTMGHFGNKIKFLSFVAVAIVFLCIGSEFFFTFDTFDWNLNILLCVCVCVWYKNLSLRCSTKWKNFLPIIIIINYNGH